MTLPSSKQSKNLSASKTKKSPGGKPPGHLLCFLLFVVRRLRTVLVRTGRLVSGTEGGRSRRRSVVAKLRFVVLSEVRIRRAIVWTRLVQHHADDIHSQPLQRLVELILGNARSAAGFVHQHNVLNVHRQNGGIAESASR